MAFNPFAPRTEEPKPPASPQYSGKGIGMDARSRLLSSVAVFLSHFSHFSELQKGVPCWAAAAGKRYCYFLRLQEKYPHEHLIPTADILFAQVCHLMHTEKYTADVPLELMPHNIFSPSRSFTKQAVKTIKLWESLFGFPYLPQDFSLRSAPRTCYIECIGPDIPSNELSRGFPITITVRDVENTFEWLLNASQQLKNTCKSFGCDDTIQLITLVALYEKYLSLVKDIGEQAGFPPCYVEIVWVTHLCSPRLYKSECLALLSRELPHGEHPDDYEEQLQMFQTAFNQTHNYLLDIKSSKPAQTTQQSLEGGENTVSNEHAVVAVHPGVHCDSCRTTPLLGRRYRCTTCPDFDLCSICFEGRLHPKNHYFCVIPTAPAKKPTRS